MKRIFNGLGNFIEKRTLLIIIIGLALIVPAIFGAMQVETNTGYDTFVSKDSQVYKDYERFNQSFSSDVVLIILKGEDSNDILDPGNLTLIGNLEDELNEYDNVVSSVGPAFMIKQVVAQTSGVAVLPDNLAQIQAMVFNDDGQIRPEFSQVFPDETHGLIAVTLTGNLDEGVQKETVVQIQDAVADADLGEIDVIVTGVPVIMNVMKDALVGTMTNMLLLSMGLMLIILALIFSVRGFFAWRWLPLGIVLIAIVYSFGVMGVINLSITMVTMAAFPILIGLGIDYGIQLHNRYDEEARRGESAARAIIDSITNMGPTIGISIVVACLGFAALFFSPVPMIREFGLTLIIGVVACYLLSVFILLAILYWHDRRNGNKAKSNNKSKNDNKKEKKESIHVVDRGLGRLAPWVIKHPFIILPVALVFCVGGLIADTHIETETDQMKYLSQDLPAIQDYNEAGEVLSGLIYMNFFVEGDVTDPATLEWMANLEEKISQDQSEYIVSTNSVAGLIMQATGGPIPPNAETIEGIIEEMPPRITSNFVTTDESGNYTGANIILTLSDINITRMEELQEQLNTYANEAPENLDVTVTGTSVFMIELLDALSSGRMQMTLIGIALVTLGLFFLFKFNIYRALLAVLPLILIIGWSSGMMYLLGIEFTPVTATLGALIIGIGAEYTILLIMRYYEERDKGGRAGESMVIAMSRIGRAVIASGFTTIGGFGALLIATDFPILQDFGIVTLINVFFALVSTLFVLPTLIVLIDRRRERRKNKKAAS